MKLDNEGLIEVVSIGVSGSELNKGVIKSELNWEVRIEELVEVS